MADPAVEGVDVRGRNPGREASLACKGVIVGAAGAASSVDVEDDAAAGEGRPARTASRSRTASGICLESPVLARARR